MNFTNLKKINILKYINYLKNLFYLSLLYLGPLKAQDIYLKGRYVEIGIHPAFSFGSSQTPPANLNLHTRADTDLLGFVCDYDKNGWTSGNPGYMGDYFTPGDPVEGWGVAWNDTVNKRNFPIADWGSRWDILNSKFVQTAVGSEIGAFWEGTTSNGINQKMLVRHTLTLDTNSTYFSVSINLKNTGSEKLKNEAFGPVMSSYFISFTMVIYNQWGEKLFESKDGSFWDGMYKNKLVPQGNYTYS